MNNFTKQRLQERYLATRIEKRIKLPLGAVTSELNELLHVNDLQHEDVDAWHAPSECHYDVDRCMRGTIEEILKKHGFCNVDVYLRVLKIRTSSKWVYTSGIERIAGY